MGYLIPYDLEQDTSGRMHGVCGAVVTRPGSLGNERTGVSLRETHIETIGVKELLGFGSTLLSYNVVT